MANKKVDSEISPLRMKITMLVFGLGPLIGVWFFLQKQGFFESP